MLTHKMLSCISFLRAGSDPTSPCFLVCFWFCLWFCVFCLFACSFLRFVFMGVLAGLCIVTIFLWSAPVAFRRVALETPEWTSRDSNHHRQSVSFPSFFKDLQVCQATARAHILFHGIHHCHPSEVELLHSQPAVWVRDRRQCPCCHWYLVPVAVRVYLFFSVQRLHGFCQVVTHVPLQQKDELQLSCKAVYLSIATKALVVDLYTVQ